MVLQTFSSKKGVTGSQDPFVKPHCSFLSVTGNYVTPPDSRFKTNVFESHVDLWLDGTLLIVNESKFNKTRP